jgi:FlgN protein
MSDMNTTGVDYNAQRLASLIGELTEIHERLLEVTRRHRAAVRAADGAAVASCVREQRELVAMIGQLDDERRGLIAQMLPGVPAREVTLTRLSGMFPHPLRGRLEGSAARLRGLIEAISQENKAVALATGTLMGHMDALVRQIASALSQSGTYGRCGSVRAEAHVACGIDVSH